MPTLKTNNLVGPANATVTTVNSDNASSDPFSYVEISTNGEVVYNATGNGIIASPNGDSNRNAFGWNDIPDITTTVIVRVPLRRTSHPGVTHIPIQIHGNNAHVARLRLSTSGFLVLEAVAGTALWTGAVAFPLNQDNGIEVTAVLGSSGSLRVRMFASALTFTGAPLEDSGVQSAALGTVVNEIRIGSTSSNNTGSTYCQGGGLVQVARDSFATTPPVAAYTRSSLVTIDATASTGVTTTLTRTSGTATFTESPSKVFNVTIPTGATADQIFNLSTVDAVGQSDVETITITPAGGGGGTSGEIRTERLVFNGSTWV